MEFFAELSVAYHCKDANELYNKWEPFNRSQLECILHDDVDNILQVFQNAWEKYTTNE